MLKDLFLTPGRFLTKLFTREKKRAYRSARSRPGESLGTVLLSLAAWLLLAGCVLYSIDKAGFLKQALDVGLEVTAGESDADRPETPPSDLERPTSGSASGSLAGPQTPPPSSSAGVSAGAGQERAAQPAEETEMWLVILHTIPKSGRDEAERRQSQYLSRGLRVEILDTDAFPRLKSGNWIIALGPYDTKALATAAANKASSFNSSLMVRRGL